MIRSSTLCALALILTAACQTTTTKADATGDAPADSKGTVENRWILGGRFVASSLQGEFMGGPFEGFGLTGYDNGKQRYVGTWCDTWGTMLMPISEGTADASGKKITMERTMDCMMTGQPTKMRDVTTIHSKDKHTYEMWTTDAEGKEFKTLEVVYTRVSG